MDALSPQSLGAPRSVDPRAIERELTRLWEDPTLQVGADNVVVRSCTLNFAVVLGSEESSQQVMDTVAELTVRHPCRIFLLTAESQADVPALEASVSALCHFVAPGHQHVCCEQIVIAARGEAVGGVPHLLLSLLVPDLPLVVWWRGRAPLDAPLFHQLNAMADRVVIDGAEFTDGAVSLARVALLLGHPRSPALSDLAWSRLTRWRTLAAQCFDAAEQRGQLERLERVDLEVNADVPTAEALLWLGWLASRLGWTPRSGRRDAQQCVFVFDAGGEVHAEIRRYRGDESYVMHRITLAATAAPAVRFTLERCDAGSARACAEVADADPLSRIVPMEVRDPAVLLSDELDLVGRDHVYEEALAVAGRLASFLR